MSADVLSESVCSAIRAWYAQPGANVAAMSVVTPEGEQCAQFVVFRGCKPVEVPADKARAHDAATGERSVYSTREVGASPALRLVTKPDGCA